MFSPTMDLNLSVDDRRILTSMVRSTTLGQVWCAGPA